MFLSSAAIDSSKLFVIIACWFDYFLLIHCRVKCLKLQNQDQVPLYPLCGPWLFVALLPRFFSSFLSLPALAVCHPPCHSPYSRQNHNRLLSSLGLPASYFLSRSLCCQESTYMYPFAQLFLHQLLADYHCIDSLPPKVPLILSRVIRTFLLSTSKNFGATSRNVSFVLWPQKYCARLHGISLTFVKSFARFLPVLVCSVPLALRTSLAPSPLALGLFGLYLGFLPFSIFYRAYILCYYQKY